MNDYQEKALRTKSDQVRGDKAPAWMFVAVLDEIVEHGRKLDALKKALFYGKELPPGLEADLSRRFVAADDDVAATRMASLDPDVVHGIVGIVTEAVELAEKLLEELDDGIQMDPAELAEEGGDVMWYQALLLASLGYGFSRVQQMNINKLVKRYPEKFSTEAALARADEQR